MPLADQACAKCAQSEPDRLRLPAIGAALGSQQLLALYESLRLIGDILEAQTCQPRFLIPGSNTLNAAGEYLDGLREAAMVAADDLADVARGVRRDGSEDLDDIDRLILSEEVRMFESASLVTWVAADLALRRP